MNLPHLAGAVSVGSLAVVSLPRFHFALIGRKSPPFKDVLSFISLRAAEPCLTPPLPANHQAQSVLPPGHLSGPCSALTSHSHGSVLAAFFSKTTMAPSPSACLVSPAKTILCVAQGETAACGTPALCVPFYSPRLHLPYMYHAS